MFDTFDNLQLNENIYRAFINNNYWLDLSVLGAWLAVMP
jgi:hypothetical protein